MNSTQALHRKEPTDRMPVLAVALIEGLRRSGLPSERLRELTGNAIKGECARCRMTITGDDLLAVTLAGSDSAAASPRIARLRNGYCARDTCDSRFYDLRFESAPDIDWGSLLATADAAVSKPESAARSGDDDIAVHVAEARTRFRRSLWLRVALPVALLAAALLFRQWYRGGTIPFIREPEAFKVDPLPPGEHDWSQGPPEQYEH
jgi:hypothetical protein